jgi:hypothetical protein
MRKLSDLANVDTSDPTNYPNGRLKNKVTGVSSGTQLSEEALGDLIQAMYETIRRAGITISETEEKKEDSDFADAVLFHKPVAIIKVGYDSTVQVLGGSYIEGYSAEYTTGITLTGAVANKLTIKKDGDVSTENFFVDVTITSSSVLKDQVTAGASHGSNNAFGYFDNDENNIHISANSGAYSDADLQKVNLIIKVFKA